MTTDFIEIYEHALRPELCEEIRHRFEASDRKSDGRIGHGVDKSKKNSTDITITGLSEWSDLHIKLARAGYRTGQAVNNFGCWSGIGPGTRRVFVQSISTRSDQRSEILEECRWLLLLAFGNLSSRPSCRDAPSRPFVYVLSERCRARW